MFPRKTQWPALSNDVFTIHIYKLFVISHYEKGKSKKRELYYKTLHGTVSHSYFGCVLSKSGVKKRDLADETMRAGHYLVRENVKVNVFMLCT